MEQFDSSVKEFQSLGAATALHQNARLTLLLKFPCAIEKVENSLQ